MTPWAFVPRRPNRGYGARSGFHRVFPRSLRDHLFCRPVSGHPRSTHRGQPCALRWNGIRRRRRAVSGGYRVGNSPVNRKPNREVGEELRRKACESPRPEPTAAVAAARYPRWRSGGRTSRTMIGGEACESLSNWQRTSSVATVGCKRGEADRLAENFPRLCPLPRTSPCLYS